MLGPQIMLVLPEILLSAGGVLLMLVAAFGGDKKAQLINALAALVLAAAIVVTRWTPDGHAFSGMMAVDGFARFAKYLIFGAAVVVLLAAPRFFEREGYRAEFPILVVFAAMGMSIMVSAEDLISLYLGLELNSLSAYVLASFMRSDDRSNEAGLKYFVLGALASGMLLYGSSLLYGFAGATEYRAVTLALTRGENIGILLGMVFALSGLAFKISAVPFHMWTPDVYEGAPTPVTAFFATAPKVAAVIVIARLCHIAFPLSAVFAWQQIIAFLAVASMVVGAIGAIGQNNIKRLLAYSSIANVGFILIGLSAASEQGFTALLSYLFVYIVMTVGSFLAVLQLRDDKGNMVESIAALSGLWKKRPGLATAIAIFMFSLAGIPPLFGFWPKLMVFEAAVAADQLWLAVVGALASVVGAFYYLRVIKVMLFDAPSDTQFPVAAGSIAERGLIAVAASYVSVLGFLFIGVLNMVASAAAASLF